MKFDACFPCFPNEVSLKIFAYLSAKDLENCATVSEGFQNLSVKTREWFAPTWDNKDWEAFEQLSEALGFQTPGELTQLVDNHPAFQHPDFQSTNPKNPIKPKLPSPLEFAFHCLRDARKVRKDLNAETVKAILALPVLNKRWETLKVNDFDTLIQDSRTSVEDLSALINKRYLVTWLLCTTQEIPIRLAGITEPEDTLRYLLSKKCFQTALNLLRDPSVVFDIERDKKNATYGYNCLHWAAALGRVYAVGGTFDAEEENLCIDIMDELAQRGGDVNRAMARKGIGAGQTALHLAAGVGSIKMVKRLVEKYGANVDQTDWLMRTPLLEAAEWGRDEVASYLLKKGANPNPNDDRKPLSKAIENGHFKIVQRLFEYGAVSEHQYFIDADDLQEVTLTTVFENKPRVQVVQRIQIQIEQGRIVDASHLNARRPQRATENLNFILPAELG